MMLLDTSVLVPLFRDKTGRRRDRFRRFVGGADYMLSRLTEIELLQGCASERQWEELADYLDVQDYVEMSPSSWGDAARTLFDLRHKGLTVRSILDCCIAQLAIEHRLTLIHDDRDFETIAKVRALRHHRFQLQ